VDPRAGLDDLEKRKFLTLPGFELRPLGRPALSQSLYRLSYPGSLESGRVKNFLQIIETGSEVHPTSYPMGTGGSFPGGKAAGA
jgi:hypothetical protein